MSVRTRIMLSAAVVGIGAGTLSYLTIETFKLTADWTFLVGMLYGFVASEWKGL